MASRLACRHRASPHLAPSPVSSSLTPRALTSGCSAFGPPGDTNCRESTRSRHTSEIAFKFEVLKDGFSVTPPISSAQWHRLSVLGDEKARAHPTEDLRRSATYPTRTAVPCDLQLHLGLPYPDPQNGMAIVSRQSGAGNSAAGRPVVATEPPLASPGLDRVASEP